MNTETKNIIELNNVSADVLQELTRRVQEIDSVYRNVAQKMGQLYMYADEHKVTSLTASLDKPMRNASDNEQNFASILEVLRMTARQHS